MSDHLLDNTHLDHYGEQSVRVPGPSKRRTSLNMNSMQSPKSVLAMAGPLIISFWMRAAFTFVDTAYAVTIGDSAIAAIGLAVPFEFIMIALWVGLSTGLTSCLGRAMGAGHSEKIEQYKQAIWFLTLLCVPVFLLIGLGIWLFAESFGIDPDVAAQFKIYGAVLIGGSALSSFWSVLPDSIVKAHQDTRSTMWAGICSNLINVVLNTLFVFVFHWGIFGIALSTVLGRFGGLAYALKRAHDHEQRRILNTTPIAGRDPRPIRAILALALPASIAFLLIACESGFINALLAGSPHAREALAAYSIYYRVIMFFLNPIIALGVALLPYCSARFGAGDGPGFRRGVRDVTLATLAYCLLLVAPLFMITAPWLAQAFAESALTAEYATFAIRLTPWSCLAGAGFLLCRPIFESMQQGRPGLIIAALRYLVLTAPGLWLGIQGAHYFNAPPVYGLLFGLLAVGGITALIFILWTVLALKNLEKIMSDDASKTEQPAH